MYTVPAGTGRIPSVAVRLAQYQRCVLRLHSTVDRASSGSAAAMASDEPSSALVEGLSGAAGGVLGLAVTYPLLAVATRLQLQTRSKVDAQARAHAT